MYDITKIRILVVDDNDFMRDLIASMLREIGFREISHAADGEAALAKVLETDPGLILCDVDMEPMNGLDFVEQLRKRSPPPPTPQVPVILLTSHSEAEIVQRAIKLGVNAYVVKPVKRNQLEARIVTVLEKIRGQAFGL
jgi:two-component system, chemotaxis family, chemotaxis protein CheY